MELDNFIQSLTEAQKQRLEDLGFTPEEFVEAYEDHGSDYRDENPSVYCGTYGKYNGGSLFGQWIDLTTFDSYDDFANYCRALHADEEDPELMFQDYENFPREFYDECLSRKDFDRIREYIELYEDNNKEAVDAWLEICSPSDMGSFEDAYQGKWNSEEDFAEYIFNECYCDSLRHMPDNIRNYIDYKAFARDIFASDYSFEDGHVFSRNY